MNTHTPRPRRPFAAALLVAFASLLLSSPAPAHAQSFRVRLDVAPPQGAIADARVVVALIGPGSKLPRTTSPHDAPFWDDPQPIFGITARSMGQGDSILLDDAADAFPIALSKLPPGEYRAAARLLQPGQSADAWRTRPGNYLSETITFVIPDQPAARAAMPPVDIGLSKPTLAPTPAWKPGVVEEFTLESKLLSSFHGSPVTLRAGIILPANFDQAQRYPAIYEVPGFGGRHTEAIRQAGRNPADGTGPAARLRRGAFRVVLDPDSPNGHTLFADSAVNGPWGRALTEELIPALERHYPQLVAKPEARLLRGHSSGGWTVLWLAMHYPTTFGAAWSTSPDPVDFRKFQLVNIYDDANMFTGPAADAPPKDHPSYRRGSRELMTIRQEVGGENIVGPNCTSGMQWASWQAVAGPKPANAKPWQPTPLFNPRTGAIDKAVAEHMKRYDIAHLLRTDPARFGPIFQTSIRLVCGDQDNFYLEQAVKLLQADLAALQASGKFAPPAAAAQAPGYIKLVPGADHGTVFASKEIRAFPQEMVDHLQNAGLLPPAAPAQPAQP